MLRDTKRADSELNPNDKITVYLRDSTCEGIFVCEDRLGMTISKDVEKGVLYMLIPWESIQWIEYLRSKRS